MNRFLLFLLSKFWCMAGICANHPSSLLPLPQKSNPEGAGILAKTVYGGITGNYGGLQMSSLYIPYII